MLLKWAQYKISKIKLSISMMAAHMALPQSRVSSLAADRLRVTGTSSALLFSENNYEQGSLPPALSVFPLVTAPSKRSCLVRHRQCLSLMRVLRESGRASISSMAFVMASTTEEWSTLFAN
jgi:hypothetical protein